MGFFSDIGRTLEKAITRPIGKAIKKAAPAAVQFASPFLAFAPTVLGPGAFGFKSETAKRRYEQWQKVYRTGITATATGGLAMAGGALAAAPVAKSTLAASTGGQNMGFGQNFLGALGQAVTQALPVGAGIGLNVLQQRLSPSVAMAAAPVSGATGVGTAGAGVAGRIGTAMGTTARAIIGSKIFQAIGRRVTPKNAIRLIKRVGIEAAAVALGITVAELAQYTLEAPSYRRRGISSADIRRTRATLRKIGSIACQVKEVTGAANFGRKRRCA